MHVLVTGGAGFIGSNFIHHVLSVDNEIRVTNLDALTYSGNLENLIEVEDHRRYRFVKGDIRDSKLVNEWLDREVDALVHFAAESHVDRSILGAGDFIQANVVGTQVLLDAARRQGIGRMLVVSTDEVYGSLGPEGLFTEESPLAPNSPYSASKAAADLLARAYHVTHGLPVVITRCSNNYGPYQFPEKLIPLMITHALEDTPLPLYGDGLNVRDWIHVTDHCRAIYTVLKNGRVGEVYNVGGGCERTNIEIVRKILAVLNKPESLITFVKDRPGHDRRYAIDSTKISTELGFEPEHNLDDSLEHVIQWYVAHRQWWQRIKTGAYQEYYSKNYLERDCL